MERRNKSLTGVPEAGGKTIVFIRSISVKISESLPFA